MPELHDGIAVLAPLIGTWSGRGAGDYPTISAFEYLEEVSIAHTGKPFLTYTQWTRAPDGQPMHAETGYLRMPADGRVELVVAHPTGIAEIEEGTVSVADGVLAIELHSTSVGCSGSAKEVVAMQRSIRVSGSELRYTLRMAAVGQPLQHHLGATLLRQP